VHDDNIIYYYYYIGTDIAEHCCTIEGTFGASSHLEEEAARTPNITVFHTAAAASLDEFAVTMAIPMYEGLGDFYDGYIIMLLMCGNV